MKSPYPPTRDPSTGLLGHWEGRTGKRDDPDNADSYDVFVLHCQTHPTEQGTCDACRVPHDGASDHATD